MANITSRPGALPDEIVEAARLLSQFFESQNIADWRLGDVAARSLVENAEQRLIETCSVNTFPSTTPPWLRLERQGDSVFLVKSSEFKDELKFILDVGADVMIPIGKPERPALWIRHPDTMEAV